MIAGGIGGGAGGGTSLVSGNVVPGTTACMRVAPTRKTGRVASKRDAGKAGDGSATAKTATPSGSFGRSLKPAGSMARESC